MSDKLCPDCKQTKPLDDFYHNKCRPDGHGAYCKQCHKEPCQGMSLMRFKAKG